MKLRIIKKIVITVAILIGFNVNGQSPEKFSYQAVVRDASNDLVVSAPVGLRISIIKSIATGAEVYVETHTPITNANGLINVEIGLGTLVLGNMSSIDWGLDKYYIRTEVDPLGGTNYTIVGTSELLSVPYALHANTVSNVGINDLTDGISDTGGTNNGSSIFLGINAGVNDDGTDNTNVGIGFQALKANTSGFANTAIGYNSLVVNTTGQQNSAFGDDVLRANTTGGNNSGFGSLALSSNSTGDRNSAFGNGALLNNTTGVENVGIGVSSLVNNKTGNRNVALGYLAGGSLTSGSNNIIIGGNNIDVPSNTASNQLNIGNIIYGVDVDGTGSTVSTGSVGIGIASPTSRLHIHDTDSPHLKFTNQDSGALFQDGFEIGMNTDEEGSIWNSENAGIRFATNNTPRMKITKDGSVGIGTDTPNAAVLLNLHKNNSNSSILKLTNANTGIDLNDGFSISYNHTDGAELVNYENTAMTFYTGGSSKMTILNNGKIGIGTLSPSELLTVDGNGYGLLQTNGTQEVGTYLSTSGGWFGTKSNHDLHFFTNNGSEQVTLKPSGKLGIGTTSPSEQLTVKTAASNYGLLHSDGTREVGSYVSTTGGWYGTKTNHDLNFFTNDGSSQIIIKTNGNVGIGTTSPSEKLHVSGNIKATGSLISGTTTYPDYVFDAYTNGVSKLNNEYRFLSLNEIASFVKKNGHLPGVTGIGELEKTKDGYAFDVSKLGIQTLEKVEELFLHAIRQQKVIDKQEAMLHKFETMLKEQQKNYRNLKKEIEKLKAKG